MTIPTNKNLISIKNIVSGLRKKSGLLSLVSLFGIVSFLVAAAPSVASAACQPPTTTYGTDILSVTAPTQSTYNVWVRMQIPSSADNSIMLQVDGGTCFNVGGTNPSSPITPNTWTWVNYAQSGNGFPVMQLSNLNAGTHSLEFIGTAPGVEIDNVLLLTNTSCVPSGTGTNCTTGQPSPTTPTNVTATATAETSVTVRWTGSSPGGPGLGLGGYYILRNGTKIGTVGNGNVSYTDPTVSGGVNYSYTVQAYDTGNPVSVSPPSSAASVTTPAAQPSSPTSVSAKATSATSVTISWSSSSDKNGPGLAGYYILRGGTKVGSVNSSATTYTDTTASPQTTYNYTVEAYDTATPANVSAQSTPASVTTSHYAAPSVPTKVAANANSSTNVTVSWTASSDTGGPGIGGYDVYRNGNLIGGTTSTTYTDTNVVPSTTYSYTIAAFDKATPPNVSAQSAAASVTTSKTAPPSVPSNVSAVANSPTSVKVSWTNSTDTNGPGLAGYYILRNGTRIGQTQPSSSSTVTYIDSNAAANTTYSYTIEAFDKATPPNVSAQSGSSTVTTPKIPAPTAPTALTAKATSPTSVALSWTGSSDTGGPGLAGYYVLRNGTTIGQAAISSSSTLNYTDTNTSPSTTYSYTIEAFDKATPPDVSAKSTPANVTTPPVVDKTPPTTPTNLMASAVSSSQINLTWTASTDNVKVAGYYVYRATSSSAAFSLLATVTTNSYGDTNLAAHTTYYYYVVAFDTAQPPNKSGNSAVVNAVTQSVSSTVTVEGKVTSAKTQAALSGVYIHTGIRGTSQGAATTYTNTAGQYVLSNITAKHGHFYSYGLRGYNSVRFSKAFPAGTNIVNEALAPSTHHKK